MLILKRTITKQRFIKRTSIAEGSQVVVTTIQSLSFKDKYKTEFLPSDFQLIISDEAHRTIAGNNKNIFEYFTGAKLGLTATPKNYLRGIDVDKLQEEDPGS